MTRATIFGFDRRLPKGCAEDKLCYRRVYGERRNGLAMKIITHIESTGQPARLVCGARNMLPAYLTACGYQVALSGMMPNGASVFRVAQP